MCALMLFAGHETTTSTIASAVLTLIQNPDQLALLQADPDGLGGGAAEESLRYEGAIKILHRWTLEDHEIRGRADQGRRPRVHRAGGREPRPGEVRGPRPLRHHARPEPAHRVRQGHPRVHRRPARPARDEARAGQHRQAAPGPAAGRRRRAELGRRASPRAGSRNFGSPTTRSHEDRHRRIGSGRLLRRRAAAERRGRVDRHDRPAADALGSRARRRGAGSPEDQDRHARVREDRREPALPLLRRRRVRA